MERNISRDVTHQAFYKVIDSGLGALNDVWCKIGFTDKTKKLRLDAAANHFKNLMEEMLTEEQNILDKTQQNIDVFRAKLKTLSDQLSVEYVKIPDNLSLLKEEQMLSAKVDALVAQKAERVKRYEELHDKDEKLCQILAEIPYYVPSGTVASLLQLKELEIHVNRMEAEKEKRGAEFDDLKSKICGLYNDLDVEPETSFAHDVVCEDAETISLAATKMDELRALHVELQQKDKDMSLEVEDLWDRLKALWNRLETPELEIESFSMDKTGHGMKLINELKAEIAACEQLKLQNIQKFIECIRTELVSWWDKCFFGSKQRNKFSLFYEGNFTEDLLSAHEEELEKLRRYYSEHREILEKVAKREELFKNMVVFDSKASDPNRFFNDRGGKLLQEEKARKKLMKDLPKMEEDVSDFISKWEQANQKEFYVNGSRFPQHVFSQWEDFHRHKEQEKQDRLKAKAKQTQEEIMFGSRSALATPGKRKLGVATPSMRTPLKVKKLNGPVKTPNTTSRLPTNSRFLQHSTLLHSPMRTPKTPLTSSNRKRRSVRLMKKAATERKNSSSKRRRSREQFSHTTVSSENNTTTSLASTCSYNDFANGLSRPNCRSSVAPTTPLSCFRR